MEEGSELKDELAVLGAHVQRFFVEELRPWAEVSENSALAALDNNTGGQSVAAVQYIIFCRLNFTSSGALRIVPHSNHHIFRLLSPLFLQQLSALLLSVVI